mgnify:FL=1
MGLKKHHVGVMGTDYYLKYACKLRSVKIFHLFYSVYQQYECKIGQSQLSNNMLRMVFEGALIEHLSTQLPFLERSRIYWWYTNTSGSFMTISKLIEDYCAI